jgi:hypothetical protein
MVLTILCPGCQSPLRVREEYAGKPLKCPRCAFALTVPSAPSGSPPGDQGLATATAAGRAAPEAPPGTAQNLRCRRCGQPITPETRRCPNCRLRLDEDDEAPPPRPRRRSSGYVPCPRCGAGGATRVTWTPWGSFYGPALFTHVRCPECRYAYNGRTGRSNLVPAIFFVLIPAVLIVAIVVGLLFATGVFGGRRW